MRAIVFNLSVAGVVVALFFYSLYRLHQQLIAEALERRAAAIQEWPFDEAIFARVVAIVTSVVTAIVGRLVLSRSGCEGRIYSQGEE